MKKTLYLFLLAFLAQTAGAQTSAGIIPADAQFVFSVNLGQLESKSGGLNYMNYLKPMIKSFFKGYNRYDESDCPPVDVYQMLKQPQEYGINVQTPVFAYKRTPSVLNGTVLVIALKDVKLFESKIQTVCEEEDGKRVEKRYSKDAVFYLSSTLCIGIKDQTAWIYRPESGRRYYEEVVETEQAPGHYYDSAYLSEKKADNLRVDSLFYESLNQNGADDAEMMAESFLEQADTSVTGRAQRRMMEKVRMAEQIKYDRLQQTMLSILAVPVTTMTANRNFGALMAGSHDAFFYMNATETLLSSSANPLIWGRGLIYNDMKGQSRLSEMKLMRELSSCYSIDFMNGKAEVNMISNYGEHVYPYMKKIYKPGQNKDLLKYIDGSNLLGIVSISANSKEAGKFYEALYAEIVQNTPILREENILPAMRMLYAFIDKEVLYNTLDGRAILACTGFTDVRMKYRSYSYDDDFNRRETTEEKIVKQPKMILAASTGNQENARKLFNILRTFTFMEEISRDVIAVKAGRNSPFQLYLALTDDALLISNDVSTLQSFFTKDGPNIKPLEKSIRKELLAHNMFMHIYSNRILSAVQTHYFAGKEQMQWYSELMTGLGDIMLADSRPGKDAYGVKATINLQDNSVNSLNRLLHFMQSTHVR